MPLRLRHGRRDIDRIARADRPAGGGAMAQDRFADYRDVLAAGACRRGHAALVDRLGPPPTGPGRTGRRGAHGVSRQIAVGVLRSCRRAAVAALVRRPQVSPGHSLHRRDVAGIGHGGGGDPGPARQPVVLPADCLRRRGRLDVQPCDAPAGDEGVTHFRSSLNCLRKPRTSGSGNDARAGSSISSARRSSTAWRPNEPNWLSFAAYVPARDRLLPAMSRQ